MPVLAAATLLSLPALVLAATLLALPAPVLAAASPKARARLLLPEALERERGFAVLPLPASVFDDPRLAAALGPLQPLPGAWVEYAIHTRNAGGVRARLSVLSALPDGRCWLEINTISEDAPPASVKLLLRGKTLAAGSVERAYLWLTGQAPLELPVQRPPEPEQKNQKEAPPARVHRGPPEKVQVRAGTFPKAESLRVGDTRFWRSAEVPLWGLVKSRSPRQELELTASGRSGAHSLFPPGWEEDPQGNGKESTK